MKNYCQNQPDRDRGRPAVPDREAVLRALSRHVNRGLARVAKLTNTPLEVRAQGCRVIDDRGTEHLHAGGYGVHLHGLGHPRIVEAVAEQVRRLALSTRMLTNPYQAMAAECLAGVAPRGLERVTFTNSGAEAVEVSLKVARLQGKTRGIAMKGGFHGKTMGALSVTGCPAYRTPFLPLLPGVEHIPFGEVEAVRQALAASHGDAFVIVEPVQAEAGVNIPPAGFLRAVREACDEYEALLILDEIQTGLGRLGAWWGADREGIAPDILLVGKALSGGIVPVAAMVATPEVFAPLDREPFLHTSTFAGNPLAMVASRAAIEVIRDEDLVSRASRLGESILGESRRIVSEYCPHLVADVRGVGLLIGIEFRSEHFAGDFLLELLQRNVIVCHSLNAHRVVRMTPPAILSESECQWLFDGLRGAAASLGNRYR